MTVGLMIALVLLLGLEGALRLLDSLTSAGAEADADHVLYSFTVDPTTGEPNPTFFLEHGGSLMIRPRYTSGERCYPVHCQAVPVAKSRTEYRIACFGGSTTNGIDILDYPLKYVEGEGLNLMNGDTPDHPPFCELVRAKLSKKYPQRHVTSYNFGVDSFDSERILPIIREVSRRLEFDLWIVYMGHNEFFNQIHLLERFSGNTLERLVFYLEEHFAITRWLQRLVHPLRNLMKQGRVRGYSRSWFREGAHFEETYRDIVAKYEIRLREIGDLARESGTPVIFNEVVGNHLQTGILYEEDPEDAQYNFFRADITHQEIEELKMLFDNGRRLALIDPCDEAAMDAFQGVLTIDSRYIPAITGIGDCLMHRGQREFALKEYYRANSLHRFPAAATPELNAILKRTARSMGVSLAEHIQTFDRIFLDDHEAYKRLFVDDVHPTPEGHRLIADHIIEAFEQPTAHLSSP
jgi:hypothetical protein